MSITEIGRQGESEARTFLKDRECEVFQADWIAFKNGRYFVVEVKHQEAYRPPRFWGHGLPAWQVASRLRFYESTGLRCMFLVKDAETGMWIYQWLDRLDEGQSLDTNGSSPRRVYPVAAFVGGRKLEGELSGSTQVAEASESSEPPEPPPDAIPKEGLFDWYEREFRSIDV